MYRSIIAQCDDTQPPEQEVLEVDVIGDKVVLQISKYTESSNTTTYKSIASVDVPLDRFLHALTLNRVWVVK